MDRPIIYTQEQPRTFDILWGWRDTLFALAYLEQDLTGSTTAVVSGFAPLATGPASLNINLGFGRIYQQASVDTTQYGSIPSDTDLVMQQGFSPAQQLAFTTSGLGAGQSRWALVQAVFAQVDVVAPNDPTAGLLYYYNSANPTVPFQGPGGNGQIQDTERQGVASVSIIYGAVATTGAEVPPTPSAGAVPLYLIDLAFGQTSIVQGQIIVAGPSVGVNVPSNYPYAPFMAGLLNAHHGGSTGQAPKINLSGSAEVQGTLPLTNTKSSGVLGGLPAMQLFAGNPNGNVAGNANVNGAADLAYDTVGKSLYVCTTTGSVSTAVWTAVVGSTSSQFAGGTTGGTANAQTIASVIPSGFSLTPGYVVTATIGAGLTNTGAATLNVAGTGVKAVNKNLGAGNVPLTGGEMTAAAFVSWIYTGTVWLLQAQALGQLATLNIGTWLKNDGSGNLTIKNGFALGDDGAGNITVASGGILPAMLSETAGAQQCYVAPISTQAANNLTISNNVSNPNFAMDCAPGRVRDDQDLTNIQIFTAITKRLDQSWVAGTNNGACDASTKAPGQTWHGYTIGKPGMVIATYQRTSNVASFGVTAHNLGIGSTVRIQGIGGGFDGLQVVTSVTTNTFNTANAGANVGSTAGPATATADGFDVLYSQSATAPTMPSGWTVKQVLGSVMTDGSANIYPFTQVGDEFLLATSLFNGPYVTQSSSRALVLASGPIGVKVTLRLRVNATVVGGTSPYYMTISSPDEADQGVGGGGSSNLAQSSNTPAPIIVGELHIRCNTSGQVGARSNASFAGNNYNLATVGWRDPRRRLY